MSIGGEETARLALYFWAGKDVGRDEKMALREACAQQIVDEGTQLLSVFGGMHGYSGRSVEDAIRLYLSTGIGFLKPSEYVKFILSAISPDLTRRERGALGKRAFDITEEWKQTLLEDPTGLELADNILQMFGRVDGIRIAVTRYKNFYNHLSTLYSLK